MLGSVQDVYTFCLFASVQQSLCQQQHAMQRPSAGTAMPPFCSEYDKQSCGYYGLHGVDYFRTNVSGV